jgi:hypothetical protein
MIRSQWGLLFKIDSKVLYYHWIIPNSGMYQPEVRRHRIGEEGDAKPLLSRGSDW